jgi:hypothetical protein
MENIDFKLLCLVIIAVLFLYFVFSPNDTKENFYQIETAKNVKKASKKKKNKSKKTKKGKKNKSKKTKKEHKDSDSKSTSTPVPTPTTTPTPVPTTLPESFTRNDIDVMINKAINEKSNVMEEEIRQIEQKNNFDNLTASNIKFSRNWTQYPDNNSNGSEISNDTAIYKQLMIVGNKSAGGTRQVGVWDQLNVNGKLQVNGQFCLGNVCLNENELSKLKK